MICSKERALTATQIEDLCGDYQRENQLARLTLPFTISLNRLFDYRLDAVKFRVTRQSIWRRWFVRAFLSTNGLHFAANARVTSPLSKDCHKRQDLEWR